MHRTRHPNLPLNPLWVRATAWLALSLVGALVWLAYDFESHARLHHHAHAVPAVETTMVAEPISPLLARALAHGCGHHGCSHHTPKPADPAPSCDEGCVINLFAQEGLTLTSHIVALPAGSASVDACAHPVRQAVARPILGGHAPTRGPPLA